MIFSQDIDDLNTSSIETTKIPDEKTPDENFGSKETPTAELAGAKKLKPRRHVRNLGFFGAAILLVALASKIVPSVVIVPQFAVYSANADSVNFDSVSSLYNISTAYNITAAWVVKLNITNPSENHALDYSNLVTVFYFHQNPLWVTMVPGFYQGESRLEFLNATFDAVPTTVDNALALSVLKDVTAGSSSGFSVHVLGNVVLKEIGKKHIRDMGSFNAVCKMDVEFSQTDGDGVMVAGAAASSGDCKVSVGDPNGFKSWAEWGIYGVFSFAAVKLTNKVSDWACGRIFG